MRTQLPMVVIAVMMGCGSAETSPSAASDETPVATVREPAKEPAPDLAAMSTEEQMAFLMELGEAVYKTGGSGGIPCNTCHMDNGKGTPGVFPPLVGQKDHMGDCGQHAGYVLRGLTGKITVDGVDYNGAMPAQSNLTDLEIAAVITYERSSWGNDYGLCLPEAVAAVR